MCAPTNAHGADDGKRCASTGAGIPANCPLPSSAGLAPRHYRWRPSRLAFYGAAVTIQPKFVRRYLPPKDHLAAIGAVAVMWTAIEALMESTILGLYEIDLGRGLVLTNGLSFHVRMSLLRILAGDGAITDTALAEEMKLILRRLDAGFGDRNIIVHGLWGSSEKPGTVRRRMIRARGNKLQTVTQDYSSADLWAIADRLAALASDFADLAHRLKIEDRLSTAPRHSSTSK